VSGVISFVICLLHRLEVSARGMWVDEEKFKFHPGHTNKYMFQAYHWFKTVEKVEHLEKKYPNK